MGETSLDSLLCFTVIFNSLAVEILNSNLRLPGMGECDMVLSVNDG